MPCYSPLHAFKGKDLKAPEKTIVVWKRSQSWNGERLDLPCGQCVGCRLERSRKWAIRCVHEASLHDENSFLTLTYDDQNIPPDWSLKLVDFQKFMKRLRKENGEKKIRYFHCGEYGEKFSRPHYHALLFGHDFGDKKFFSERGGNRVYTSDTLSRLWPYGFSVIGEVTFESAAYVARYVMKKITGEKAEAHYGIRRPEYITMSRRPGIGKNWFDKYSGDVYPGDRIVTRGNVCRPPRFYDELYGKVDPAGLSLIKLKREEFGWKNRFDNDSFRLPVKEKVKNAQVEIMKRSIE